MVGARRGSVGLDDNVDVFERWGREDVIDAKSWDEFGIPAVVGAELLFAVVVHELGFEQFFDGGVFATGIEVAHENEGLVFVCASLDGFENEFGGFLTRCLAAMIQVGVVNVDCPAIFSYEPSPCADAGNLIPPGLTVRHCRGIGKPESAVLGGIELPGFSVVKNG